LNDELVAVANTLKTLEIRSKALDEAEARLRQDFNLYPDLSRQHTDLQRQLKIATASLERFLETREGLEIKAAQQSQPWQLLSAAPLPNAPISPDIPRNLTLGMMGALLVGGGAAVLAEKFKDVFHSVDDLRACLTVPILGIVPFQASLQQQNKRKGDEGQANLLLEEATTNNGYTSNGFIESFRSLYSALQFLEAENPVRSLVISSATPDEGKSTTAYHLAMSAAAMGKRVLLIDADLRRPTIHEKAGLKNGEGLSNILTGQASAQKVIQPSPRESNLFVLTAGATPPDPTRLLASDAMKHLMQQLQNTFDLVIYDSPPVLAFADSLLLSPRTQGCLVVVGLGYTDRNAVRETFEQLQVASTPVLGVLSNCRAAYTQQHRRSKYYNYYTQPAAVTTPAV
jgi:polysaccharide biosynthesis transport protein